MGMTIEQFWDEPPVLAKLYREAHKIRRQLANEQAWLQGLYVYDALAVILANAFSKRGAKQQVYIERPLDIYPISEAEKKRREMEEFKKIDAQLQALRRMQKKQGG